MLELLIWQSILHYTNLVAILPINIVPGQDNFPRWFSQPRICLPILALERRKFQNITSLLFSYQPSTSEVCVCCCRGQTQYQTPEGKPLAMLLPWQVQRESTAMEPWLLTGAGRHLHSPNNYFKQASAFLISHLPTSSPDITWISHTQLYFWWLQALY